MIGAFRIRASRDGYRRGGRTFAQRAWTEVTPADDLSAERVELFRQQKNFQLIHGFLDRDFDFDAWIDPRPLAAAHRLLAGEQAKAA